METLTELPAKGIMFENERIGGMPSCGFLFHRLILRTRKLLR